MRLNGTRTQILIIGHTGFLGSVLVDKLSLQFDVVTIDRNQLDLANNDLIEKLDFKKYNFKNVIICAAITDIETCFKSKEYSYQINVAGTKKLLQKIKEAKSVPIFFSSDYVFKYSEKPLRESDEKSPITVYGQQKLEVENFIKANFDRYLIFRTSKLMSKIAHPKNILLPTLKNLANSTPIRLFEDQWLNPIFVEDIAAVIEKSIQANLKGEFHLGTKTVYTRAELGRTIAQYLNMNQELIHSSLMKEVSFSEPRPHHNVLNCERIEKALNFEFTEIKDGIGELAQSLGFHATDKF